MKVQRINEQMWENNNQRSKLLDYLLNSQNLGKFSIIEALYFLDLENFHALQNLENKWKLWTLKNFKEALDLKKF